ncbi:MAG: hypothetical protein JAY99_01825 [Candidatus Thiodiazotropha lotti]|uniref:Uncharacterized protein n=1 Tax=Candidatus Thiodiazotropha endoloripes TaxID=1818881 RepID=A0A1E2UNX4_9GAMM|nr:hypothetical protein [Candidatus Thiodiazotropha endoloripes]MCG7900385.1 hypothetical protein [Candidatus Thiodiazotropha weberae]MCG7991215.1 hypothetical protein [Candidatus Thiodiazotropha lotti]MCG7903207.1 hypothetical protein [Candidatus Thiodiazotropha weberae]MCG7915168.1 hypothetical protein [Candidatus Thiodiazotropha weberae]MCG7998241.1 hypothetical protein [Candidatus Thiodiazotropha lotti]
MGAISTRHYQLILQFLFAVGILFSILIFYVKPPLNYACLAFMGIGLISGLIFLENVQHKLVRLVLFVPIFWLVVIISLAVAKVLTPYF